MDARKAEPRLRLSITLKTLGLTALLLWGCMASAATRLVTFGDSLTHNDLLWIYYQSERELYGDDPAEAAFNKARKAGDTLSSYAIAGSTSQNTGLQISAYELLVLLGQEDRATLIHYEIGGNDILNNAGTLAANPVGTSPSADAIIDNLIANVTSDLTGLSATHPGVRFVVWTIPDITVTPEYCCNLTDAEVANIRQHIERANVFLKGLSSYASVAVLDLYALSQAIVANPPVIFGHQLLPPPAYGDFGDLFADAIHPTAVANALIANAIGKTLKAKWGINIPAYTEQELADLAHIPY